MSKPGVIIANLGSPASSSRRDVRRFLSEFLSDPYVINLPSPLRQILVRGFIAPLRSSRSAHAYAQIWEHEGGPLRNITQDVASEVGNLTGYKTVVGMRYGNPSLRSAFDSLRESDPVVLVPIYPQYADSTWTTLLMLAQKIAAEKELRIAKPFYSNPDYIDALVIQVQKDINPDVQHLVVSFHSLPEIHLKKTDPTNAHCLAKLNCCDIDSIAHATCYRHQCLKTANALSSAVKLPASICFQSRLGRLKWLEPTTSDTVHRLALEGVQRIAVVCPSFTVDNLETLEEIGIRASNLFKESGGAELQLIPSLNTDKKWIQCIATLIQETIDGNEFKNP